MSSSLFDKGEYAPQAEWVEEIPVTLGAKPQLVKGERFQEPVEEKKIFRFGGLDMAKRVDHSALEILRLYDDRLKGRYLQEEAFMVWPHVKYRVVAGDIYKIYEKYPWEVLGYDRSGVGDAASEFFDITGLSMQEIVTTQPTKLDIVKIIRGMFETKRLYIGKESELHRQIEEQEVIISNAGNELYQHPKNRHDDRFWALGYACYVALPYVVGYVEPMIRQIGTDPERDIESEMDALLEMHQLN